MSKKDWTGEAVFLAGNQKKMYREQERLVSDQLGYLYVYAVSR